MFIKLLALVALVVLVTVGVLAANKPGKPAAKPSPGCDTMCTVPHKKTAKGDFEVVKSDAEWRKTLSQDQFYILRQKGTEQAFTGAYWNNHDEGVYVCAGCGATLFASKTKFDSGTGWPSFYMPISLKALHTEKDTAYGMVRVEVMCGRCGGHLGHVFDDGPKPTGLRYCINSASLKFTSAEPASEKK
ncbi:MAG: peptide-methionine (R)-S-oxide reductase MsrB [Armatimonadetes bacterium]|nr:peptide-methionine (R)-S-oxide reductase MsrB [Armatimonadota bacterium]